MTNHAKRVLLFAVLLAIATTIPAQAGDWSEPVQVLHEFLPCVTYQARLDGDYLVVRAKIEEGWHTFVMDNKERATEKLAGRKSLGIDAPTQITLSDGLEQVGAWYQPDPEDFSKPDLRWYSWGYENEAQFVTKVERSGAGPAKAAIRGQACTETTCKNIDVELAVPIAPGAEGKPSSVDLAKLIPVQAAK